MINYNTQHRIKTLTGIANADYAVRPEGSKEFIYNGFRYSLADKLRARELLNKLVPEEVTQSG